MDILYQLKICYHNYNGIHINKNDLNEMINKISFINDKKILFVLMREFENIYDIDNKYIIKNYLKIGDDNSYYRILKISEKDSNLIKYYYISLKRINKNFVINKDSIIALQMLGKYSDKKKYKIKYYLKKYNNIFFKFTFNYKYLILLSDKKLIKLRYIFFNKYSKKLYINFIFEKK